VRVISGKYKSIRLSAPKGLPTRPTTDKAKESLFNILSNQIELRDIKVLDLFAGIGGISLEFLSRGAESVLSVEMNRKAFQFLNQTKRQLEIDNWKVYHGDVFKVLKKYKDEQFDLIFADPPYDIRGLKDIPELVFKSDLLKPGGWLIVEHSSDTPLSDVRNFVEQRTYSKVNFSIFQSQE
jgi:16S rRNA (guanine966-N2)-methyltransferase